MKHRIGETPTEIVLADDGADRVDYAVVYKNVNKFWAFLYKNKRQLFNSRKKTALERERIRAVVEVMNDGWDDFLRKYHSMKKGGYIERTRRRRNVEATDDLTHQIGRCFYIIHLFFFKVQ